MGHAYQAVGWSRQKRVYDLALAGGILLCLAVFGALMLWMRPDATAETLIIRSFGATALVLLHVVLSIGPLCRINPRFLPLLYNRRHMGVAMFVLALGHGALSFILFHTLGVLSPFASLFAGDTGSVGFAGTPFQPLGAIALGILFVMAATSHDFWLRNLTPRVWKTLHMLVYAAYALVVMHVALGFLQSDTSPLLVVVVALGMAWITGLHVYAASRERKADQTAKTGPVTDAQWLDAGALDVIPDNGARTVTVGGERVAIFRYDSKLSAVASVCRHQGGPLGEGRVVDGCIVCPWHGYQYRPADGCSPAPFTEKVATYRVRVVGDRVQVCAEALPAGTFVEPTHTARAPVVCADEELYVGYQPRSAPRQARFTLIAALATTASALLAVTVLASYQRELKDSRFEFGVEREFRGVIEDAPYPLLRVARPGTVASQQSTSAYMLVAQGKFGADETVKQFVGKGVSLRGSLVHQGGRTMIELVPDSLQVAEVHVERPTSESLGEFTLRGEIVDSKCHLGVMNPGERRTHRACAKLCIRGGIPPILWVEDGQGAVRRLLLVDTQGQAVNERVIDLVGDPVEITGEVERVDDLLILKADPATYQRLVK
jgi:nitrite reductase/ring-hydroxylating ferredoxin subunit/DMSO/TMAO reductase YedYZ heme-binding membrane subunit